MREDKLKQELEQHLEPQYDNFGVSIDLDEELDRGYLCITFQEPEYPSIGVYVQKMTEALDILNSEIRADYQPDEHKYELEISPSSDKLVPK